MVELIILIALNMIFLTLLLSNHARLLREEQSVTTKLLTLSLLLMCQDQLAHREKIDASVMAKKFLCTKPYLAQSSIKPPFRSDGAQTGFLLSMQGANQESCVHPCIAVQSGGKR